MNLRKINQFNDPIPMNWWQVPRKQKEAFQRQRSSFLACRFLPQAEGSLRAIVFLGGTSGCHGNTTCITLACSSISCSFLSSFPAHALCHWTIWYKFLDPALWVSSDPYQPDHPEKITLGMGDMQHLFPIEARLSLREPKNVHLVALWD